MLSSSQFEKISEFFLPDETLRLRIRHVLESISSIDPIDLSLTQLEISDRIKLDRLRFFGSQQLGNYLSIFSRKELIDLCIQITNFQDASSEPDRA